LSFLAATSHSDVMDDDQKDITRETPVQARPGDHYGQHEPTDAISVSDTQSDRAGDRTQDLPAMSQNRADVSEKIEGVLVQTRADVTGHDDVDARALLAERLGQAGIALTSDEFDEIARRL